MHEHTACLLATFRHITSPIMHCKQAPQDLYMRLFIQLKLLHCRQARQNLGTGDKHGGIAGMGFEQPSPSGLQLAGQLSPLQESSFTPHRTQPKNNLRQLLGNTGVVPLPSHNACQQLRN